MAAFPLSGLDYRLLEKIITKMPPSSYFRLQQTCLKMKNFVREGEDIRVHANVDLKIGPDSDGVFRINEPKCTFNSLFGIRVDRVYFNEKAGPEFDNLCKNLKMNKIQCCTVVFQSFSPEWTKEDWLSQLKILQPVKIIMWESRTDAAINAIYESAAHIKMIIYVARNRSEEEAIPTITKLVPLFEEVLFYFIYDEQFPASLTGKIEEVIQLFVPYTYILDTYGETLDNLKSLDFKVSPHCGHDKIVEVTKPLELPDHFPIDQVYLLTTGTKKNQYGYRKKFYKLELNELKPPCYIAPPKNIDTIL